MIGAYNYVRKKKLLFRLEGHHNNFKYLLIIPFASLRSLQLFPQLLLLLHRQNGLWIEQ